MIVTYTPDEGEPRVWPFKPDRLLTTEAEAVERVTGQTYREFGEALFAGSVTAYRALVWVLRKRNGVPDLRFKDVVFPIGALSIDLDDGEKVDTRKAIEASADMSEDDKAEALSALGPVEDAPDPKAVS